MALVTPPVIEESDLGAIIAQEIGLSQTNDDTEVSGKRARALEYMRGYMPDLPAAPNTSKLISSDLADTVSWILPSLMRVFDSSDNMAEFQPQRQSDEESARQATDYVNYVFKRESDGYRIIQNATYDSLVLGNGLVRVYWDNEPLTETETLYHLTEEQIAILQSDEDVTILTQEPNPEPDPVMTQDETGEMVQQMVPTVNVKVEHVTARGKLCFDTLKPENLIINGAATSIEDARAVGYLHDNKSRSDLVAMGFDPEVVMDLPRFSQFQENEVSNARHSDRVMDDSSPVKSGDLIDLYEFYLRADIDGDGRAELVQAWYAGGAGQGSVLAWSVWEEPIPFVDFPCYPQPHRFDALGLYDRTGDVQRAKTVLLRQATNNLYASNIPQREIEEGSVINPDALVHPTFGAIIWKKKGASPIVPHAIPFVADKVFGAMDYFDRVIAKRTGVSPATMALDPEALQNQTATASQNMRDAGYSQIEIIARNHAELGWSKVFTKALKLLVKHQDRPRAIRLRDTWVEMDPRTWNANMDAVVNVGLGTGSKDRDMAMLTTIQQQQLMQAQMLRTVPGAEPKALEYLPKIIDSSVKIAEMAGLKNPEAYFPEITQMDLAAIGKKLEEQAGQPSPEMQAQQAKMQADQQNQQAKLQFDQQKASSDNQIEMAKIQSNATLQREQMTLNAQIKREQIQGELQLKREQLTAELQLKAQLAMLSATNSDVSSSSVDIGGEPG